MPFYLRKLPLVLPLLLAAAFTSSRADAQQAYEFGIRFNPVNFRPVNFNGFSFQQSSYRGFNTQPIQFEQINFPAFNARTVRQAARETREPPATVRPFFGESNYRLQQRLRLAVADGETTAIPRSRTVAELPRTRLALSRPEPEIGAGRNREGRISPDVLLPTRLAHSLQSSETTQNVQIIHSIYPLDSLTVAESLQSSAGGQTVAARLAAEDPSAIARRVATSGAGSRSSTAPANRGVERFRLGELAGRETR